MIWRRFAILAGMAGALGACGEAAEALWEQKLFPCADDGTCPAGFGCVETAIGPRCSSDEIAWVEIPPGSFAMGCAAGSTQCYSDENPVRGVTVAGFRMGKTEVTVAAYEVCVYQGVCTAPEVAKDCNWGADRNLHPINCVDWSQANAFCRWVGGRLPSAEEWEYAAKSGEPRIYPWGDEEPTEDRANYNSNGTRSVGAYPAGANKWGVLDMAGNVWEWTATNYDASHMEQRGGGWNNDPQELRASIRNWWDPSGRYVYSGFRCAQ